MKTEKMDADYWQGRSIFELAWFLTTGESRSLPKQIEKNAIEDIHIAYLNNFIPILDHLMRSTFFQRGRQIPQERLTELSKKAIKKALRKNLKISKLINPQARLWIEGGRQRRPKCPSREEPLQEWIGRKWDEFLSEQRKAGRNVITEHSALHAEFFKLKVEPEKKRRSLIDLDRSVRAASHELRGITLSKAEKAIKASGNRKLVSPELNIRKMQKFYLKHREEIDPLYGSDTEANQRIFDRRALKIQRMIENSLYSSKPDTYFHLLDVNGKTPSIDEIKHHLGEAMYLSLG